MPDQPKVSIVIPTFNSEKYIQEAVDSCLQQSWANYEVLIVDDGSTDGTLPLLDKLYGKNEKIKIIPLSHDGRGIGRSLNTGIQHMQGEWFRELQSDDVMLPDGITQMMYYIYNGNAEVFDLSNTIFYGDVQFIDNIGHYKGTFPSPDYYNKLTKVRADALLLQNNFGNGTTVTIHKTAFQKHGKFPEDTWHEDYLHRMQWCIIQNAKMHHIPYVVAKYRTHPASFTHSAMTWKEHLQEDARIKSIILKQLTEKQKDEYAGYILHERFDRRQFPEFYTTKHSLEDILQTLMLWSPFGI